MTTMHYRASCSLYLEDILVSEISMKQKRKVVDGKVVKISA